MGLIVICNNHMYFLRRYNYYLIEIKHTEQSGDNNVRAVRQYCNENGHVHVVVTLCYINKLKRNGVSANKLSE